VSACETEEARQKDVHRMEKHAKKNVHQMESRWNSLPDRHAISQSCKRCGGHLTSTVAAMSTDLLFTQLDRN
jgi:tRNA 2-selenouridine synthase SelU